MSMQLSRRRLFGLAGAGAVAAGVGGAAATAGAPQAASAQPGGPVPFHGAHQAGITTPAQDRLHFAAFDVTSSSRTDLAELLRAWTDAAARMCSGRDAGIAGAVGGSADAPPDDTGEALGLPASRLTVTVGFGPSLFAPDRFGLAGRRPAALADLPAFPHDALDPARSGGDICIQACADDPQVAVHAVRNLARIGFGTTAVRWSQLGFGRTSSTSTSQATPRNLFGFKDGTANLKAEEPDLVDRHVWAGPEAPPWMRAGSYLVARRIRMTVETWDRASLGEQETVIGRAKGSGAPLGSAHEFDRVDLAAKRPDGHPAVPVDSHVRLAHPDTNGGAQLLRRGYSFVDGSDPLGRLEAGLFFLAYQRDPRRQFVRVQQRLAESDAMNEYVRHVGSGLYACPPGVQPGGWWGQQLFA